LTCDKCEDIHIAQRAGKQSDECKCSCHKSNTYDLPHWQIQPLYQPYLTPCTGDPIPPQGETICGDPTWKFSIEDDGTF